MRFEVQVVSRKQSSPRADWATAKFATLAEAQQRARHENMASDYSSFGVWDRVAMKWESL